MSEQETSGSTAVEEKKEEATGRDPKESREKSDGDDGDDNQKKGKDFRKYKRKFCRFKANPELAAQLHYTNTELLSRFISNRGKILPRRITGTSAYYQRKLAREIRRARQVGLLPYKVM